MSKSSSKDFKKKFSTKVLHKDKQGQEPNLQANSKSAEQEVATYFDIRQDVWEKIAHLSDEELWKINQKFLENQVKAGKIIQLARDPEQGMKSACFYGRELRELKYKYGYDFEQRGGQWYAVKQ